MTMNTFLGPATMAALLTAVTGGVFTATAHAAAPQVGTQAPAFYRMKLGDFEITALSDGTVLQATDKVLTNIRPELIAPLLAASYLTAPVEQSINAFLINTGSKLFLVDTGAGELFGPGAGHLVTNMRAAGYEPEQVDAVLLTHIHTDHSGGLELAGKRVFPNAFVYANKREVDFWLNPANAETASDIQKPLFRQAMIALTPYIAAGRLGTFEANTELAPGIKTFAAPGHTPGHGFYVVESQGQKLVFWGDVMHQAAIQFLEPSVTIKYDVDSNAAETQRQKAFADAARQGYWVAIAHVPFPGIGHLRPHFKGYTWLPAHYSRAPWGGSP
ncbi:MBL fold metallo-hydrolase [Cystobacter fuscus]|uniref:MBL fold metallo-hydrolase n=1 Tax=Cystobacter fuscus TaxID=43 RepID=UPI002B29EB95|nr:MBL fold metallo-hydrolase [Cystobacter fuscus]